MSQHDTPDNLPELSRRQEDLLSLIIRTYSENPEPVSSKHLVERGGLDISSATVRNEMARLEEMGYITAPHTSAGRIPTVKGYRYFVRGILESAPDFSLTEQAQISNKFSLTYGVLDQWMRQAATVLARTASTASWVTAPSADGTRFKHTELIVVQGRLVLMVLVLQGGIVLQRMLNLADALSQSALSETATRINGICESLNAPQIRLKARQMTELEREILDVVVELMESPTSQQMPTVYQDGLSDIIRNFSDNEGAQQAVRVIEEPTFLDFIVREFYDSNRDDALHVIIGGEGRFDDISQLSIILSRYGVRGQLTGTIGVFGPTRINYDRAIRTVRYVAGIMTHRMANLYEIDGSEAPKLPPNHTPPSLNEENG